MVRKYENEIERKRIKVKNKGRKKNEREKESSLPNSIVSFGEHWERRERGQLQATAGETGGLNHSFAADNVSWRVFSTLTWQENLLPHSLSLSVSLSLCPQPVFSTAKLCLHRARAKCNEQQHKCEDMQCSEAIGQWCHWSID